MKQIITAYLFILIVTLNSSLAQQIDITELKKNGFVENVNSIVLDQQEVVNIISQNLMHVKKTRKVLILNELGEQNIDAYLYYDDRTKIKNLALSVYSLDQAKPIKVVKEKEFKDYNASDGFSIVTDNRIKTSGYKHVLAYPFIAEFVYEYTTSNTAHIPSFHPFSNSFETILSQTYQVNFDSTLGFQKLEKNLAKYPITSKSDTNSVSYTVTNLKYSEREELSLSYSNTMPHVIFGLNRFNYEGISANIASWNDFGKWYYSNFIEKFSELSPQTIAKVKELTNDLSNPIEKAKVLYKYLQSKTRYISVQLGVGGWKPFPAKYVDQKGFGDCKALSNYMAALLKAVDIDAYVTIVKAGESFEDINDDIVSMQGNHMILALPNGNDYIFIECTSQTAPFSYIDNFTDGRKVVIIKPNGAEIYKTPTLLNHNNLQKTLGTIHIDDLGAITTELSILNKGSFFDDCSNFPNYKSEDVTKMVKSRYDIIKNVDEVTFNFINDKDNFAFTENYTIKTKPYLKKMGNQFIVPLNMIHPVLFVPKSYKNRKFDFTTGRGYLFEDEFTITIPESAEITYLPENQNIINEFGEYKIEIKKDKSNIVFKRTFLLKSNNYSNTDYDTYKKFRENISQLESMKLTYKL